MNYFRKRMFNFMNTKEEENEKNTHLYYFRIFGKRTCVQKATYI